jgi:hypothetical protein
MSLFRGRSASRLACLKRSLRPNAQSPTENSDLSRTRSGGLVPLQRSGSLFFAEPDAAGLPSLEQMPDSIEQPVGPYHGFYSTRSSIMQLLSEGILADFSYRVRLDELQRHPLSKPLACPARRVPPTQVLPYT